MTLLGFFWFIVALAGAFILGILVGRFHEGKLIVDGEVVGGNAHHGADDHHH